MAEEKEEIIIKELPRGPAIEGSEETKSKLIWKPFLLIFGSYLILLAVITFLPITFSLKLIGLMIGSFLIEDLHRSLKARGYGTRNY